MSGSSSAATAQRSTSRRDALYDAVIESVGIHGFARASLRDIAGRAGMTHAGLLSHFNSKEELLLAAVRGVEERERAETQRIIAGGASDREVIEALVTQHTQDLDRERHWLSLVVAASEPGHPAHDYFRQRHEQLRAQVEAFAQDPAARTVGQYDPETRATLYMAVMDGLRLQWIINPSTDVVSAAGRFADLILRNRTSAQPLIPS